MTTATLAKPLTQAEMIRILVDAAPPLSDETRARIRELLKSRTST